MILISGLKRSGTTVLWQTFRNDKSSLCLDEPFHPSLWRGRRLNAKGTLNELGALWKQIDFASRSELQPIMPLEEMNPTGTSAQSRYLAELSAQSERTVVDEVRIWNRLPEILSDSPQTLVIHLIRSPANWVTGQMKPNEHAKFGLRDIFNSAMFFHRKKNYNNWRFEDLIEAMIVQKHRVCDRLPIPSEKLKNQPAFVKLLAFWWASNLETCHRLASWKTGRTVTLSLPEFLQSPKAVISNIYAVAGWGEVPAEVTFDHLRPVRSSWKVLSPNWTNAFEMLGIPLEFIDESNMTGERARALMQENSAAPARARNLS